MKASILILSSDTKENKGYPIRHCLASIWKQENIDFSEIEIVIAENSKSNKEDNLKRVRKTIDELDKKFQPIHSKIIDINPAQSRGEGRNIAAKNVNSELIIFLDDDTILYSKDAVALLLEKAKTTDYGYGANRLWTDGSWFQENADQIFEELLTNKDPFVEHTTFAPSMIRGSEDTRLQHFSFIGNWGYCNKTLFEKVGGYPDFEGRDFEDDFLTFKLYKESGNYGILFQTSVIHVTHGITEQNFTNISNYYDHLNSEGYFWFNVGETFHNEKPDRDAILQPLHSIHVDYRVEEAYKKYLQTLPPYPTDENEMEQWIEKDQLSLQEFTIQIQQLLKSENIDEYVKYSRSHFDDLIPVLESALSQGILQFHNNGKIEDKLNFKYFPDRDIVQPDFIKDPNESYNQFPCTVESRNRRIELLHERFPLTDHLRVGIIGDDDLVSIALLKHRWLDSLVIETDEFVIRRIHEVKEAKVELLKHDLREYPIKDSVRPIKTFITDPPYTLYGALLFILQGMSLMEFNGKTEEEFYVILNPSMMGRYMQDLQRYLSEAGVWVHEVIDNFSQYELPIDFQERVRANNFLKKYGLKRDDLKFSSSSNLYIFRSVAPNLDKLRSSIIMDEVYNHFI